MNKIQEIESALRTIARALEELKERDFIAGERVRLALAGPVRYATVVTTKPCGLASCVIGRDCITIQEDNGEIRQVGRWSITRDMGAGVRWLEGGTVHHLRKAS